MERREKEVGALVIDTNIVISSLIPAKSKLRDPVLTKESLIFLDKR
ncbi:MAG: hypothetical protein ACLFVX_09100 [Archaeoglobaceae archaeon]